MRLAFDYLYGPVLGHRRRCELLMTEMQRRNHSVLDLATDDCDIGCEAPHDWYIADFPRQIELPELPRDFSYRRRLIMGDYPRLADDWAWHPLGEARERTMVGPYYLLVHPSLASLVKLPKERDLLITYGGAGSRELAEWLLGVSIDWLRGQTLTYSVMCAPTSYQPTQTRRRLVYRPTTYGEAMAVLSDHRYVLCAWGQTVFEALASEAYVIPVASKEQHFEEAARLGLHCVKIGDDAGLRAELEQIGERTMPFVDTQGATRVAQVLERIYAQESSDGIG
jgi:hypothetical protein